MYKHIMLPVDNSERSAIAVREAIRLAKSNGAKLTAIHVVNHTRVLRTMNDDSARPPAFDVLERQHDEASKHNAERMLADVASMAKNDGVECDSVVVLGDSPHEHIVSNAAAHNCDLIMMASRGRGPIEGALLGSETLKVLSHSSIPVLVLR